MERLPEDLVATIFEFFSIEEVCTYQRISHHLRTSGERSLGRPRACIRTEILNRSWDSRPLPFAWLPLPFVKDIDARTLLFLRRRCPNVTKLGVLKFPSPLMSQVTTYFEDQYVVSCPEALYNTLSNPQKLQSLRLSLRGSNFLHNTDLAVSCLCLFHNLTALELRHIDHTDAFEVLGFCAVDKLHRLSLVDVSASVFGGNVELAATCAAHLAKLTNLADLFVGMSKAIVADDVATFYMALAYNLPPTSLRHLTMLGFTHLIQPERTVLGRLTELQSLRTDYLLRTRDFQMQKHLLEHGKVSHLLLQFDTRHTANGAHELEQYLASRPAAHAPTHIESLEIHDFRNLVELPYLPRILSHFRGLRCLTLSFVAQPPTGWCDLPLPVLPCLRKLSLQDFHLYPAFCLSLQRLPLEVLECVNVGGFASYGDVLALSLAKTKLRAFEVYLDATQEPQLFTPKDYRLIVSKCRRTLRRIEVHLQGVTEFEHMLPWVSKTFDKPRHRVPFGISGFQRPFRHYAHLEGFRNSSGRIFETIEVFDEALSNLKAPPIRRERLWGTNARFRNSRCEPC